VPLGSNALVRALRLRASKKPNFFQLRSHVCGQENPLGVIKLRSQKSQRSTVLKDGGGHSRSPASSTGTLLKRNWNVAAPKTAVIY
jgi:hypothetical protein